jgi:hypothetical protein
MFSPFLTLENVTFRKVDSCIYFSTTELFRVTINTNQIVSVCTKYCKRDSRGGAYYTIVLTDKRKIYVNSSNRRGHLSYTRNPSYAIVTEYLSSIVNSR